VSGPYQGLMPFTEADAAYFFGREVQRAIITDNFIASRLTLLYAPSGVGKTSVLLAGVVHDLRAESASSPNGPEYLPVVVRQWTGDPVGAIDAAAALAAHAVDPSAPDPPDRGRLVDRLRHWSEALDVTLLLVLDQFEEFLLYHAARPGDGGAAAEVARAMAARELRANYLLGLREDALASLDRFKGRVPNLFDNYLRLDYLDREGAHRAIVEPIEEWNREQPDDAMAIDPELADTVIDQVTAGRVELGRTGGGRPVPGHGVESAFLQLVMTRLWEEERARGSNRLRVQTLVDLGGAAEIIRDHVDGRLARLTTDQQDVAAAAFRQLVTPTGRKVASSLDDLAAYTEASPAELGAVLEALATGEARIVRSVDAAPDGGSAMYEVFHDVLCEAVLDWRARHDERRRRGRLLRRAIVAGVVAAVVVVAAVFATAHYRAEQQDAARSAQRARVAELIARSQAELGSRPIGAMTSALQAAETTRSPTPEALRALRTAVARSDLRGELKGASGPTSSIRVSPDGRQVAAAGTDGRVLIWSLADPGHPVRLGALPPPVLSSFSGDGRRIAVAGRARKVEIWRVRDGRHLRTLRAKDASFRRLRWSPTGRQLAAVTDGAELWDLRVGSAGSRRLGDADLLQWSKGGTRFATATTAGKVTVWRPSGKSITSFDAGGPIEQIGFTPDGSDVLVAHADGTVTHGGTRCEARPPMSLKGRLAEARFSPDGRFVVMHDPTTVRVQDVRSCRWTDLRPGVQTTASAVSTDGTIAAARGTDGAARVWDVRRRLQLATLIGDSPGGTELALRETRDGTNLVFTSGDDGTVREWQVAAEPIASLLGRSRVLAAGFAGPGDAALAVTGRDVVRIDGSRVSARSPHPAPVDAAVIGRRAAIAVMAARGRLYAMRATGARATIGGPGAGSGVSALAVSDDGERAAATYRDGRIVVWDIAAREQVGEHAGPPTLRSDATPYALFAPGVRSLEAVTDAIYRYDPAADRVDRVAAAGAPRNATAGAPPAAISGNRLAAVAGGQVAVFDLRTGRRLFALAASTPLTEAIAFSSVGNVLATAGPEGVRLWDASTGDPVATLASGLYNAVSFSSDGRRVLAGGDGMGVQVFACRACVGTSELLRDARALTGNLALLPGAPQRARPRDAPFRAAPAATPSPPRLHEPVPPPPADSAAPVVSAPVPTAQAAPEGPPTSPRLPVSGGGARGDD
jgi:WD40 repeat protein